MEPRWKQGSFVVVQNIFVESPEKFPSKANKQICALLGPYVRLALSKLGEKTQIYGTEVVESTLVPTGREGVLKGCAPFDLQPTMEWASSSREQLHQKA